MKYNWLAFLSRLAFICNICFLFILSSHYLGGLIAGWHNIVGTVVILGFISLLVNVVLQTILLVLRVKSKTIGIKAWIRIFNVAIFAVQIVYYFII